MPSAALIGQLFGIRDHVVCVFGSLVAGAFDRFRNLLPLSKPDFQLLSSSKIKRFHSKPDSGVVRWLETSFVRGNGKRCKGK